MEHVKQSRNEPLHSNGRAPDPQTPAANSRRTAESDRISRSDNQKPPVRNSKSASIKIRTHLENSTTAVHKTQTPYRP
jgi:hypothetical protein